jgi:aminomethyltransferase
MLEDLGFDGFIGTPFHSRSATMMETSSWFVWPPYIVPDIYTDFNEELAAMRTTATINEMSPLSKTRVFGPDAGRFADRILPRDALNQDVGQILYSPSCNESGKMIADGLIFRFAKDEYVFVAGPQQQWFEANADGFAVEITDISASIGILALQGPLSTKVLEAATRQDWSDVGFSRIRKTTIAGVEVDVSRQGFTGEVGYEVWVDPDGAPATWDKLVEVGSPLGLRPAGEFAIDIARVEAGLLIIGADYMGAGPDPTPPVDDVTQMRECSPVELRLGRLLNFDTGDFIGRDALLAEKEAGGPPRRMVGLSIDWRTMLEHQLERGELVTMFPRVHGMPLPVLSSGDRVGYATSVTWGPSVGMLIGLGHINKDVTESRNDVSVLWTASDQIVEIGATIVDLPFTKHRRA